MSSRERNKIAEDKEQGKRTNKREQNRPEEDRDEEQTNKKQETEV